MAKPHLLYVLPYLEQGGTEKQALALIDYFRHIYTVSLLAPWGSTAYQFQSLDIPYWQFCRWDFNFWLGLRQFVKNIRLIQQQQPIDLIHVHASHELMAVAKLCFPRVPVIFTVHGYHGSSKNLSYWSGSQIANWFADRVIAVCQTEADILTSFGLETHKITVICNGVKCEPIDVNHCDLLRQKYNILDDEIVLGTVARLSPDKGINYLLEAMANLKPQYPRLRLIIAGTGSQQKTLEELADSLGLQNSVTFVGYLDRLGDLMCLFDIFVLPSLQEAFSLATLEAMALAKPIVATTVGGFKEQIQDTTTGFLVPPQAVVPLTLALEALISAPQKRQLMGQAARAFYAENFTIEKMLDSTKLLYSTLSPMIPPRME